MGGELPADWQRHRLGDLVEVFDGPHATPRIVDEGPVFLGIQALQNGRLSFENTRHVTEPDFAKWTRRVEPRAGDVVFSYETRLGEAAVIPPGLRCCLGRRMGLLRIRPGAPVTTRMLLFAYLGPQFKSELRHNTINGSTVDRLPINRFGGFSIVLPPVPEQRAIASVLGALDDKIESNRHIATAQRSVRLSRYRHTVRASDERAHLSGIARLVKGTMRPAQTPDELFEQFSIPAFDDGEEPELCLGSSMASGKTPLPPRPVMLLSKLNPGTPRVWAPSPSGSGVAVCSPEFLVLEPNTGVPFSWLESCVRSDETFYAEIMAAVTGTTGSRQRVKPSDAMRATVPVVDADMREEWAAFAQPLISREAALASERRTLTALRDALLPKLVSGQIRVPLSDDPEEGLGAAVEHLTPQRLNADP